MLEIGCGKGEFLVMMAEAGIGAGTGIDPGVHPERVDRRWDGTLTWIADRFDQRFGPIVADAVVCRHTLEHIAPVGDFVRLVRVVDRRPAGHRGVVRAARHHPGARRGRLLGRLLRALLVLHRRVTGRLFAANGFEVEDVRYVYGRPVPAARGAGRSPGRAAAGRQDDVAATAAGVDRFATGFAAITRDWTDRVRAVADSGEDGSSGVAARRGSPSSTPSTLPSPPSSTSTRTSRASSWRAPATR